MARTVSSRVTLNTGVIRRLEEARLEALEKTAEFVHTEVVQAQVIPRDTGALQNEKFFCDYTSIGQGVVSLVFEGPYARRLYFHPEYHFRQFSNPNAKGKWLEDWTERGREGEKVVNAYAAFYRQITGV